MDSDLGVKPFRRSVNELGHAEIVKILGATDHRGVYESAPVDPKGGDVFLLRHNLNFKYRCDHIRWKNASSINVPITNPELKKYFFYAFSHTEKDGDKRFKRIEYRLIGRVKDPKGLVLVHYRGDESVAVPFHEANARIHQGPFVRNAPYVLPEKLRNWEQAARTFKATRQRAPVEELHCEIHVDPEQTAQMKSNGRREALGCEDGNGREDVTGSPGDAVPDGADSRPESLINDKEDYGNEGPSKPRGDSIPSSSKMAYEEHRVRLKALVVSYETELLKKQLAEEQLKMAKEEHLMKVQLIAAQMMRASGN